MGRGLCLKKKLERKAVLLSIVNGCIELVLYYIYIIIYIYTYICMIIYIIFYYIYKVVDFSSEAACSILIFIVLDRFSFQPQSLILNYLFQ